MPAPIDPAKLDNDAETALVALYHHHHRGDVITATSSQAPAFDMLVSVGLAERNGSMYRITDAGLEKAGEAIGRHLRPRTAS